MKSSDSENESRKLSLSLQKLPLSLRFIIKSLAFTAHHKHLHPPIPDSSSSGWEWIHLGIGFLIYIGTYIGLLLLLCRVTTQILIETFHHFKAEGFNPKSIVSYIRYGVNK